MAAWRLGTPPEGACDAERPGRRVYPQGLALTASGDICPGNGELLIRLHPLTAPRCTQALAALCDQLTAARARYPGTDLILRYEVKSRPSPA